eukprot:CAMPEP_0184510796 /NCGR_PEP_ID=MMETSP0198_2-20121128/2007_1 /TAXON_ID=1112570 /ORGANISM="Thraustochytrium sp., Strain LLF1b" /LENGTH=499 /DNA_ID=CAMNT_0026900715 /DNA_START=44 /DNA_END=1539 /DNA_ORIENTATION=+
MEERLVLSVDAGTQSFKLAVYDSSLKVVGEHSVPFSGPLGERFGASNSPIPGQIVLSDSRDSQIVRAPVLMWCAALDEALEVLSKTVNLGRIVAVCGAAQQHSSVWWKGFPSSFQDSLEATLRSQDALSTELCPVWADTSTSRECREIEAKFPGGRRELLRRTGSVCLERFTGSQILRLIKVEPDVFQSTQHIQLLSTALCSIFAGKIVPSDCTDAGGMNLMDLGSHKWLSGLDEVFGVTHLEAKLGELCKSGTVVSKVSQYMQSRYGFSPSCKVVSFTGDNPATLAGCTTNFKDVVVSLGTSDTVLVQQEAGKWDPTKFESLAGVSTFPHLLDQDHRMLMVCFKNGGGVRNTIKGPDYTWAQVDAALGKVMVDDSDVVFFHFPDDEITPRLAPCSRAFSCATGNEVDVNTLSWEQRIRGTFIMRALSVRSSLEYIGAPYDRIVLGGGGSQSKAVCTFLQNIWNVPVARLSDSGAACRGAARLAFFSMGESCDLSFEHV